MTGPPAPDADLPEVRRALYTALAAAPLGAGLERDPFQVDGLHPPGADPLLALLHDLDASGPQCVELVAGARGTGRRSALRAIARELGRGEAVVVRFDVAAALPASTSLRPEELHIALVGGVDDSLSQASLVRAVPGPSTWERVARLLPRRLGRQLRWTADQVRGLLLSGPTGGLRLGIALSGVGGDLRAALDARFDDLLEGVRRQRGAGARLVVLVEGLDRLGVSPESTSLEAGSVLHLLLSRGQLLALPETRVVALVPACLAWAGAALAREIPCGRVRWWPCPPLLGPGGRAHPERLESFVDLARRRGDWTALGVDPPALAPLITASGGHPGILLALLRELVLQDSGSRSLAARLAVARRRVEGELLAGLRPEHDPILQGLAAGRPPPLDPNGLPLPATCELLHVGALLGPLLPGASLPELQPSPLLPLGVR